MEEVITKKRKRRTIKKHGGGETRSDNDCKQLLLIMGNGH